jgi:integrase
VTRAASSSGRVDDLGRALPAGVYFRPEKPKPYLVRIGRGARGEAFETFERAVVRSEELRRLRELGVLPVPVKAAERTVGEALDDLLARKRVGGRRGPLRERGLEHWERSCRFWRGQPFAGMPLRLLDVTTVENAHLARAADHPTAARNELEALKAALRYAAQRNSQFQLGLLEIEPLRVEPERRGTALTLDQLEFLCRYAPDYLVRCFSLLGTIGLRVSELCGMRDEHVDLVGRSLRLPAELCKEKRPKTVPLFADEARLLADQLGARPAGAERVFPRKGGTPWRREHFYHQAVVATRKRAAIAWRREHSLAEAEPTPFEWTLVENGEAKVTGLAPHDFRRTAATLMRDAGFTKEHAATRLGHGDDGELLDRLYDRGDRVQRARHALDEISGLHEVLSPAGAGRGGRARAHAESTSRPSRGLHLRAVS